MATAKLDDSAIRMFLMDKKELNPLLKGVRWSTEDVDGAIQRCVDFYNDTPPFIAPQRPETFPFKYVLLVGVAGHLLRSAAINEASNQLDYSADGVTVQDKNKADIFLRMGNAYWQEFTDKVGQIKVTVNLSGAFGTIPSELQYMAR